MKNREQIQEEALGIKDSPNDVYSKIVRMQELTLEVLLDMREALIRPLYISTNDSELTHSKLKKVFSGCLICSGEDHLTKDCPSLDEKIGGSAKSYKKSEPVPFSPIVSLADFNKIKNLKDEDMTAVEVSGDLDLPLQQVNFSFQARNYEDYVRLAKLAR